MRRLIMEHPCREATQREIGEAEAQIAGVQGEGGRVAQAMARRRQQFALLFNVIEELHRAMEDDPLASDAGGVGGMAAAAAGAAGGANESTPQRMDVD